MATFKLTVAYDGTGFVGWQRQAAGTSIQGLLEEALSAIDGGEVVVTGAGRTDAGVHASGQVASASLKRAIAPDALRRAINAHLPPAVRVLAAATVSETFHPRFHARAKTYRYRIWNAEVLSPFERHFAWHVPAPILNLELMAAAAARFIGRRDFAAMQAAGSGIHRTDRTVLTSRIARGPDPALLVYEITGNGFLRHMVRNIVGTLMEVGRGRRPATWVDEVLASKDRARGGPTAPAEGLFLAGVEFESIANR
jgi:tRNA pseudouridine38-40 synthase